MRVNAYRYTMTHILNSNKKGSAHDLGPNGISSPPKAWGGG